MQNKSIISFTLVQSSQAMIRLLSTDGRIISTIATGNFDQGNHQFSFDRSSLAEGIYFLQLLTDSELVTKKLVVQ